MFEITYKGKNSVIITTKSETLWVNPQSAQPSDKGLKEAVQLATEPQWLANATGDKPQLEGAGEYEVGSFTIHGVDAPHYVDVAKKATSYRVEVNDTTIGLLGNVQPNLSEDILEQVGIIDILLLPIGSATDALSMNPDQAAALVRKIEPKIIIPVADGGGLDAEQVELLAKDLGVEVETQPKLKIKSRSDLPQTLSVVYLTD